MVVLPLLALSRLYLDLLLALGDAHFDGHRTLRRQLDLFPIGSFIGLESMGCHVPSGWMLLVALVSP